MDNGTHHTGMYLAGINLTVTNVNMLCMVRKEKHKDVFYNPLTSDNRFQLKAYWNDENRAQTSLK